MCLQKQTCKNQRRLQTRLDKINKFILNNKETITNNDVETAQIFLDIFKTKDKIIEQINIF